MFDFHKLDVYRCAVSHLALASSLARRLPAGHEELGEQLRRAAVNIPLSIAEGSAKLPTDGPGARRCFGEARRAALEAAAMIDVLETLGAVAPPELERARALLERIFILLGRMVADVD
jgi:four helix bundle protein